MAPADVADWGWRIPFVIGCLIVPLLFVLRRSLQETENSSPAFTIPSFGEIARTLAANWALVLGGVGLVVMTTVSFYLITVYTPSFGKNVLKLAEVRQPSGDDRRRRLELYLAADFRRAFRPDRPQAHPRRHDGSGAPHRLSRALLAGARPDLRQDAPGRALAVAALRLVQRRDGGRADRSHPRERAHLGFSLAYSLATTLGGSSLAISTWLIHHTGDNASPGFWMSFAALCGLAATLFVYSGKAREVAAPIRA